MASNAERRHVSRTVHHARRFFHSLKLAAHLDRRKVNGRAVRRVRHHFGTHKIGCNRGKGMANAITGRVLRDTVWRMMLVGILGRSFYCVAGLRRGETSLFTRNGRTLLS